MDVNDRPIIRTLVLNIIGAYLLDGGYARQD